ncbi:MAG TPA: hypothetical protein VJ891_00305 [Casimicrobiaceae bacterium]|nr:hypothetical protein [Casimicrobiaceae bacterium]
MSAISDILDRLSGVEVVKERMRTTGERVEQWANEVVVLNRQVQEIERRLVRIETLAEIAARARGASRAVRKLK